MINHRFLSFDFAFSILFFVFCPSAAAAQFVPTIAALVWLLLVAFVVALWHSAAATHLLAAVASAEYWIVGAVDVVASFMSVVACAD